MNILLVTETYLPYISGVASSTDSIARYMVSRGHKVIIANPRPITKGDVELSKGIKLIFAPSFPDPLYKGKAMAIFPLTFINLIDAFKKNKFDVPLPLHYSKFDIPEKLYRPVRHLAPSYMGTSIWSHWGMEYIKTLIYLGQFTDAKKHLDSYKKNIETYGGYPELYDKKGHLLHTRLYRGVLHNGWVINYEQTKMLYDNAKK